MPSSVQRQPLAPAPATPAHVETMTPLFQPDQSPEFTATPFTPLMDLGLASEDGEAVMTTKRPRRMEVLPHVPWKTQKGELCIMNYINSAKKGRPRVKTQ